jgi:hypothetical protein
MPLLVSEQGCKAFCGSRLIRHTWDDIAEPYLTWVFPVLGGLLLQMPFESGSGALAPLRLLARWLGNPAAVLYFTMSSISYMGDMCELFDVLVGNDRLSGNDHSNSAGQRDKNDHSDLRDGLLILAVLNQYRLELGKGIDSVSSARRTGAPAYRVMLFALFVHNRNDAGTHNTTDTTDTQLHDNRQNSRSNCSHCEDMSRLCRRRAQLADYLRATRRRGITALLVSLSWFCAAMSISVDRAFRSSGVQMSNLPLGLIVSWMPPLVACVVVDRHPASSRRVRHLLQEFLDDATLVATVMAAPTAASTAAAAAAIDSTENDIADNPLSRRTHLGKYTDLEMNVVAEDVDSITPAPPPHPFGGTLPGTTQLPTANMPSGLSPPGDASNASASSSSAAVTENLTRQTPADADEAILRAPRVLDFFGGGRSRGRDGALRSVMKSFVRGIDLSPSHCSLCKRRLPLVRGLSPSTPENSESTARSSFARFVHFLRTFVANCFGILTYVPLYGAIAVFLSYGSAFAVAQSITIRALGCGIWFYFFALGQVYLCVFFDIWDQDMTHMESRLRAYNRIRDPRGVWRVFNIIRIVLESLSCGLLLLILIGQPIGLNNSCRCRSDVANNNNTEWYVSLEADYLRQRAHARDARTVQLQAIVVGCLPLLISLYAVYAWCTQSVLWSTDYGTAMRGVHRIRWARYILRFRWCADIGRTALRLIGRARRALGDAVLSAALGGGMG